MSFLPQASAVDLQAPYLAGFSASLFLTGILLVQADTYASQSRQREEKESFALRAFVAFLVTLTLAEVAGDTALVFNCFFSPLHAIPLSCALISSKHYAFVLSCDTIISTMAQSFFMIKAWRITDSNLALGAMSFMILFATLAQFVAVFIPFNPKLSLEWYLRAVYLAKGSAAAADILISGIFVWKLRQLDRTKLFASTDSLVLRLRSLSLQTASVTTLGAIATIIIAAMPRNVPYWGVAFNFPLGQGYAICTLHVLNHRRVLQAMMKSTTRLGVTPSPVVGLSGGSSSEGKRRSVKAKFLSLRLDQASTSATSELTGMEIHLERFAGREKMARI